MVNIAFITKKVNHNEKSLEWPLLKKQKASVDKYVKKMELLTPSHTAGYNIKCAIPMGNNGEIA